MESWVYFTGSGASPNATVFDTRVRELMQTANACAPYITSSGKVGIYSSNSLQLNEIGGSVSLNVWTHVAWVLNNGTWTAYVNGISVGTLHNTLVGQASPIAQLGIGVASDNWNLTAYKFRGKLFQPMIAASTKYVSNFVPLNDLSVGASSLPVVFFMNPGVSGDLSDLVTASSVPIFGTAVTATSSRYLTY
jgi:hypothetical protein